jgi:hypothetical protein
MKTARWSLRDILPIISIVITLGSCVVSALAITTMIIDRQKAPETPLNLLTLRASATETFVVDHAGIQPTAEFTPYQSRTPIRRPLERAIIHDTPLPTSTRDILTNLPTYTLSARITLTPSKKDMRTPEKTPYIAKTKSADPPGAIALCNDGTYSYSPTHLGACAHHGDVNRWIR